MGVPFPRKKCCCTVECDNCTTCPGEFDSVWVVLDGTAADGTYNAVWDPVNSWWTIDFGGGCTTVLECASGGGVSWTLFGDQACPIGGTCETGSPLVITPAPDCDNCDLDLPNGTLAIHWTCGGEALPMRLAMQCAPADPLECVHRGPLTGATHQCEVCGRRHRIEPVYECAIHGTCTLRRWKNGSDHEPMCIRCYDIERMDGTKPRAHEK
jgi:hypothetical protein